MKCLRCLATVLLTTGVAGLGLAGSAEAATNVQHVILSSDVTVAASPSGAIDDDTAVAESVLAPTLPFFQPAIPTHADLDAVHKTSPTDGEHTLFSVDTAVLVGAGLTVRPGDVAAFDGAAYWLEFDASVEGLPSGVNIDAVAQVTGDLLLSFDTTVDLGSGLVVQDEDLVRVEPTQFSLYFDGSSAGVDAALDVDGANRIGRNGNLLLSFDTGGTVGGVSFDRDDILEYNTSTGGWQLSYDAGTQGSADWSAGNVDALWAKTPKRRRCGLGFELVFVLAPLLWFRRLSAQPIQPHHPHPVE